MKESDMRDTAGASPTPEYLNAFLDGELTADERAHVLTLLESDPEFKARAISFVLAGGIVTAILGPQIVIFTRELFAPVMFAGSFATILVLAAAAFHGTDNAGVGEIQEAFHLLDTLLYLRHETAVWFEITTLLIPGHNDSDAEITALSE